LIGEQGRIFLLTLGIGAVVGLVYDAWRVLRLRTGARGLAVNTGDLLFWVAAFAVAFGLLLRVNHAELRFYVVVGIVGGAGVYFSFLGRFFFRLLDFTWHVMGRVGDFLFMLLEATVKSMVFPARRSLVLIWWPVKASYAGGRHLGGAGLGGVRRQAGILYSILRKKVLTWKEVRNSNKGR